METLDFSGILRSLETVVEKVEKLEDRNERRKILPNPTQLDRFKKLASRIVKLRRKLATDDERVAREQREALDAFADGLFKGA